MLKSKKGFTLVELCVVMAVAAIVGTMIVTFMMFATNQQLEITKEGKGISEITEVQKKVNDWLNKYDNAGYTINHKSGQTALEANKGLSISNISFSENTIKVDNVSVTEKFENITGVSFQIIEDKAADGTVEGKAAQVIVTVKSGKGTETQTLLFPLFSDLERQRSVTGKNG